MPPQIFQPLLKRQEMREDFQREIEFAFEDMYTGERSKGGSVRHCIQVHDCEVVRSFHSCLLLIQLLLSWRFLPFFPP